METEQYVVGIRHAGTYKHLSNRRYSAQHTWDSLTGIIFVLWCWVAHGSTFDTTPHQRAQQQCSMRIASWPTRTAARVYEEPAAVQQTSLLPPPMLCDCTSATATTPVFHTMLSRSSLLLQWKAVPSPPSEGPTSASSDEEEEGEEGEEGADVNQPSLAVSNCSRRRSFSLRRIYFQVVVLVTTSSNYDMNATAALFGGAEPLSVGGVSIVCIADLKSVHWGGGGRQT